MKFVARAILFIEPLFLMIIVASNWFPEPYRVNTLLLLIPPLLARLILYRRLWVNTPLNILFYLFVLLCALNTYIAMSNPAVPPYSWGWYEAAKPLMGVAVALSMASLVYERGRLDGTVLVIVLLAVLVGVLGLTSAQYIDKSDQLQFLINLLPQVRDFPGAVGGFNVNEIGGAMTFFVPLAAGIAFFDLRTRANPWTTLRGIVALVAFLILALAMFLGQSRLALVGVVLGLGIVSLAVIPRLRWRILALALIAVFCAVEVGVVLGVFNTASAGGSVGISSRDTSELSQRPVIWGAALHIIRDYPLTGVGLNQFRSSRVRAVYPVPNFAMVVVPHAHDEFLQVGTDTGIPGMILYFAWSVALIYMAWRAWRGGDSFVKAVAASAIAGLLAHSVFGLADAITMYDRFGFAYWLFVGLVAGAYVLARKTPKTPVIQP